MEPCYKKIFKISSVSSIFKFSKVFQERKKKIEMHMNSEESINLFEKRTSYLIIHRQSFFCNQFATHITQNIAEKCQKFFQSFIAIEILPQHFCQLFQNISL